MLPSMSLRALPSVDRLAGALDAPPALAVRIAREVIDERRAELVADGGPADADLVARARARVASADAPSLRRVLNATGVLLHTNLGRAPLAPAARAAVGAGGGRATPTSSSTWRRGSGARATPTSTG
jgi:L-seryl-tRNA(Ser) seleniumtransferase